MGVLLSIEKLLGDWGHYGKLCRLLLFAEALLCALIVIKVPYTEIDWIAYMQEVEGWIVQGSTDYATLKGDTGPLVYPAGFLYVYRFLRWVVGDAGRSAAAIQTAQWMFAGLYLAVLAIVLHIYGQARPGPPWIVLLLALSKRLHSLFILRLFNDCITMGLAYAAIALFMRHRWYLGCAVFSLALSVKMNVLLFAPGLAFLLLRNTGVSGSLACAAIVVSLQVLLGWPFLSTYPSSYAGRAFELGRVFFHRWTVNWKFVPEDVFVGKAMAGALLAGHLLTLVACAQWKWSGCDGGLVGLAVRAGVLPQSVGRALLSPRAWALLAQAAHDDAQSRTDAAPVTPETTTAGSGVGDEVGMVTSRTRSGAARGATLRQRAASGAAASASNKTRERSRSATARRAGVPPPSSSSAQPASTAPPATDAAAGPVPVVLFRDSPAFIAYVLLASNFVGIAFARTLHYQFYSWYAQALPALAAWGVAPPAHWAASGRTWQWPSPHPLLLAVALGCIEYGFNVGDAAGAGTPVSSAMLQAGHAVVLYALLTAPTPGRGTGKRHATGLRCCIGNHSRSEDSDSD